MKPKSKKQIIKKIKQFRYHNVLVLKGKRKIKIRHPAYAFLKRGNINIYVILTHSSTILGKKLIRLKKNPNPNDARPTFFVEEFLKDTTDRFGKSLNKWIISEEDDLLIRKRYKKR